MQSESSTFTEPADVEAVLLSPLLVPPPQAETLAPGPTADLRNAMARFSDHDAHRSRRAAVDMETAAVSTYPFAGAAQHRAAAIIARIGRGEQLDGLRDIAFEVPVTTLADALGVPTAEQDNVRSDVKEIAKVIGRGEPSNSDSDEATIRLVQRFDDGTGDHVARVSLLYQAHDATPALFASALLADQTGNRRRPAVAATTRMATDAVGIGNSAVSPGTLVAVDLESTRFEFGLGPHYCPGRSIAERLVAGMINAVGRAGLEIDLETLERQPDGRPKTLPLRSRPDGKPAVHR